MMFGRARTNPEALELRVARTDNPKSVNVENDWLNLEDFEREYVSFGGSFGTHGPAVFAAAPELLRAVIDLLGPLELAAAVLQSQGKKLDRHAQASFDRARAAVAKAKGAPS